MKQKGFVSFAILTLFIICLFLSLVVFYIYPTLKVYYTLNVIYKPKNETQQLDRPVLEKNIPNLPIDAQLPIVSYNHISFKSPWGMPVENKSLNRITRLTFQNGITMTIGASPKSGEVPVAILNDNKQAIIDAYKQARPNSYELEKLITLANSSEVSIFALPNKTKRLEKILIAKALDGLYTNKGKLYELKGDKVKGFQVGDPGTDQHIAVDLYTDKGTIGFRTTGMGIKQDDLNVIISTVHTVS